MSLYMCTDMHVCTYATVKLLLTLVFETMSLTDLELPKYVRRLANEMSIHFVLRL